MGTSFMMHTMHCNLYMCCCSVPRATKHSPQARICQPRGVDPSTPPPSWLGNRVCCKNPCLTLVNAAGISNRYCCPTGTVPTADGRLCCPRAQYVPPATPNSKYKCCPNNTKPALDPLSNTKVCCNISSLCVNADGQRVCCQAGQTCFKTPGANFGTCCRKNRVSLWCCVPSPYLWVMHFCPCYRSLSSNLLLLHSTRVLSCLQLFCNLLMLRVAVW